MRLLFHMLVVVLLGPSLGFFIYSVRSWSAWAQHGGGLQDAALFAVPFSILAALVASIHTVPLALLAYVICYQLCRKGVTRTWQWIACGLLFGTSYASWLAHCEGASLLWGILVGGPIGILCGYLLHEIWVDGRAANQCEMPLDQRPSASAVRQTP